MSSMPNTSKILLLVLSFSLYLYLSMFVSTKWKPSVPDFRTVHTTETVPVLLFYGIKWWEQNILKNNDPFRKCSRRCEITTDVSQNGTADVVIFQADNIHSTDMPEKADDQTWVYSVYESLLTLKTLQRPLVTSKELFKLRGKFNWTMEYRRDSDFVITFGRFIVLDRKNDTMAQYVANLPKTKTKTATWFNSHCSTESKRESYVAVLKRYLSVVTHGKCGKRLKKCNPKHRFSEAYGFLRDDKCMDFIDKDFRYFLSFENSLCLDYITEKSLQRISPHFIVPVVRAQSNLSLYFPPGAVTDTRMFKSAKEIAIYLTSLSNQNYIDFYSWRKHYRMENFHSMWLENICRMCERAYSPEKYHRIYQDMYKWLWKANERDTCKYPSDIK